MVVPRWLSSIGDPEIRLQQQIVMRWIMTPVAATEAWIAFQCSSEKKNSSDDTLISTALGNSRLASGTSGVSNKGKLWDTRRYVKYD